tara:strand:- start:5815 stop:6216 length:402 start_codon:yes stop_codon:yes gene_type:complete
METSLQDLLAAINDGRVLTPDVFGAIDCDEILESRENEGDFDDRWNKCLSAVEKEWAEEEPTQDVELMIDEIREISFEIANHATEQHDLASHISDDFDLFARIIVLERSDAFAEALWEAYENGEIPSPATLNE